MSTIYLRELRRPRYSIAPASERRTHPGARKHRKSAAEGLLALLLPYTIDDQNCHFL